MYLRIADDLRRQIVDGRLAAGDKVPSRHELAREYEVSDRVAVQAVRLLVTEGYLEARPGSGTYVRQRPTVRRMMRSWYRESRGGSPFRADMEEQSRAGTWTSSSTTEKATPTVAERLNITEDDAVMCTQYVFRADDEPVMLSTSWEPLALTRGTAIMMPEQGPHAGQGVVARMRAIGLDIATAEEVLTARAILANEAELLHEPLGSIVMVVRRTYTGEQGPVETADIVVPVDRYELAYITPVE
ncbi:GntR family transcriptional regulator [Actinomadura hibisca]|uniref:GntR family transcriptional regulator n=1 Tax=Actinomadura hibisca TaxID=68565 RepID=UPI001FDFAE94|nr:GntR family transcriptional regulator [Actinomadura hibisca]